MQETQFKENENFRAFYENVGALYPEEDLVYDSLRGRVRKKFVLGKLAQFTGRFLDLGCNRGTYLAHYSRGPVWGVDLSLPALRVAKQRHSHTVLLQGDAQNLSFLRDGTFDCILCSEMLEHVPRPEKVISECYRLLKPGGTLLITTPNYRKHKPTWMNVGKMAEYGISGVNGDLYFHTAFRPEELSEMAKTAGFSENEVGTFEQEVKFATRLPVVFYYIIDKLNRHTLKSEWLAKKNENLMNRFALWIYEISVFLHVDQLLAGLFKEGVRTYLVAHK